MTLRRALLLLLTPLLLIGSAFALDRAIHRNDVLRNVMAGPVTLTHLSAEDATTALLSHEDRLVTAPAEFLIDGAPVTLDPELIGLAIPVEDVVGEALAAGRAGSVWSQFQAWWRQLGNTATIDLPVDYDPQALQAVFDQWDATVIGQAPSNGNVTVEDDLSVVPEYPVNGVLLARPGAEQTVAASLRATERETLALPTRLAVPSLTGRDVDEAADRVRQIVSGAITLTRTSPDATLEVSARQLANAIVIAVSDTGIDVGLDHDAVEDLLRPLRDEFESPPQDAELIFEENLTVTVKPGVPGDLISADISTEALLAAAATSARTGEMPFERGAEPEVTTEDLEALGIRHLVSQFTTYHDCCQNRVVNIQLMADIVSGTIVEPGGEFSLNGIVGERTAERGFLPAGTIIAGKIEDTVGGGVSQFATTMYNAMFWGGYEDVTHTPHSYYFSRYPEGIEATVNWPSLDLVFRNDTSNSILVRTLHTESSITVQIWGDNGGRIVAGDQRGGQTSITVVDEGIQGRTVSANVSGRFAEREPEIEYVVNDELEPGTESVEESGRIGWSVNVTRTILQADGVEVVQEWVVRYRPQPRVVEVHSCDIPEGEEGYTGEECPEPTTTTTSTTTTTTLADGGGSDGG